MSRPRSILGRVGHAVAWIVILAAVSVLALAVVVPRLGGATPYTILTGSMRPGHPPGTLVVVKPVDVDQLRVGDVVTYQVKSGDPTVVTHRIVAIAQRVDGTTMLQTQGDANDVADDPWVKPVQVKGRLWYSVPYLGRINTLLTGRQHEALVYGAVGLLGTYALAMFVGALRDRVRRRGDPQHVGEPDRTSVGAGT